MHFDVEYAPISLQAFNARNKTAQASENVKYGFGRREAED
jgi:hypothetical protein